MGNIEDFLNKLTPEEKAYIQLQTVRNNTIIEIALFLSLGFESFYIQQLNDYAIIGSILAEQPHVLSSLMTKIKDNRSTPELSLKNIIEQIEELGK